jgi:hypothetical protein
MRRFQFKRNEDETGISGTGIVAEGVVLTGGRTVVNWLTKYPTTSIYDSFADAEFLHGHDGKTEIVWLDQPDDYDMDKDPWQFQNTLSVDRLNEKQQAFNLGVEKAYLYIKRFFGKKSCNMLPPVFSPLMREYMEGWRDSLATEPESDGVCK